MERATGMGTSVWLGISRDGASSRRTCRPAGVGIAAILLVALGAPRTFGNEPWQRHTIDASSRGADGVRLADANGDGLLDLVTGWEEGGRIRIYLHPGYQQAHQQWPAVTVGEVPSPEDAVMVDLDGDGAVDVVSSCEGRTRTMFVHWAPAHSADYLDPAAWKTERIPATYGRQAWMYALPLQVDGRASVDLVVGSKGEDAAVGWLEAPGNPRDLAAWRYHRLHAAGWIMSLVPWDADGDGDLDILVSDRKGLTRGVIWLENPGSRAAGAGEPWPVHHLGGNDHEVMFLAKADAGDQQPQRIVAATLDNGLLLFTRHGGDGPWQLSTIDMPPLIPHGKGVQVGDMDADGQRDLVVSAEKRGRKDGHGVMWMQQTAPHDGAPWKAHTVSGTTGDKFDLVQLMDVDGDDDPDIITCEERENLGVFWYENPR